MNEEQKTNWTSWYVAVALFLAIQIVVYLAMTIHFKS